MERPLDTLYYQWALSEEDKAMPGFLEEVVRTGDAEKISTLLEVFAHMVADVIEAEMASAALKDGYVERASGDRELLANAGSDDITKAIQGLPDVQEAQESAASATKRLELFQRSFARALVGDADDGQKD